MHYALHCTANGSELGDGGWGEQRGSVVTTYTSQNDHQIMLILLRYMGKKCPQGPSGAVLARFTVVQCQIKSQGIPGFINLTCGLQLDLLILRRGCQK